MGQPHWAKGPGELFLVGANRELVVSRKQMLEASQPVCVLGLSPPEPGRARAVAYSPLPLPRVGEGAPSEEACRGPFQALLLIRALQSLSHWESNGRPRSSGAEGSRAQVP